MVKCGTVQACQICINIYGILGCTKTVLKELMFPASHLHSLTPTVKPEDMFHLLYESCFACFCIDLHVKLKGL